MKRHVLAITLFLASSLALLSAPLSESAKTQIEADWNRQEQVNGRAPGSAESITLAIVRGRALAAEIKKLGFKKEAEACLGELGKAEKELPGLDPKNWQQDLSILSEKGWHLVRAAVCGAGASLDHGRVRGRSYRYPNAPKKKDGQPSALRTVSFDDKWVMYRFSNLSPEADYRLRAIYGVDKSRTLYLSIDGKALHSVTVPVWAEIGVTARLMIDVTSTANNTVDQRAEIAERWAIWREEKLSRVSDESGEGLNSASVFAALSNAVPSDAVIAVDVGNNTYSFGRYFECKDQRVLMSGYLGSIGFSFSAAMVRSASASSTERIFGSSHCAS